MKIYKKAIFLGLVTDIILSIFVGGLLLSIIFGPNNKSASCTGPLSLHTDLVPNIVASGR